MTHGKGFRLASLGHVCDTTLGKMLQTAPRSPEDQEVPYLRAGSLEVLPDTSGLPTMFAGIKEMKDYSLRGGDLLIAEGGDAGRAEFVPWSIGRTIFQNSLHRVRLRSEGDLRFVRYALVSIYCSGYLDVLCNRTTFGHLTVEKLRNLRIPWPSSYEQRRIADYLDIETVRIEALVSKKRRLIGLLKEQWDTWIREQLNSLTCSLLPLKRKWRVIDCKHRTPDYVDHGYPVVSPGDISPGRLDLSRAHRFVGEIDYRDLAAGVRKPNRKDVLYSRNASIGIASYVDIGDSFCMGQDVCLITSDDMNQLYLMYVLNSIGLDQLELLKIGSTFDRVNISQILEIKVPVPSLHQQQTLAYRFDDVASRMSKSKEIIEKQIDLLHERWQVLVTAVVTGEISVSGVNV